MTREESINKWIIPAIKNTWNEKKCNEILKVLEQEPCEDAISRQAVQIELKNCEIVDGYDENDNFVTYYNADTVDSIVRNLPPVTPAPNWISCSERLPEDRRIVLVTAYWHEAYQVMEGVYFGDGEWWCVPFNNSGEHMQRLAPIAWIPLPEAYKGGD